MTAMVDGSEGRPLPARRVALAHRLREGFLRWPLRITLPALVAITALLGAAVLTASVVPRWTQEQRTLELQARADAQRLRALREQTAVRSRLDARALRLPASAPPEQRLPDLLEAAVRAGVAVDRIQQRLEVRGRVQVLRVSLSAAGRYGELRDFIESALRADPALSLDRVQMRRSTLASDRLDADLQWSVHHDSDVDDRPVTSTSDSPFQQDQGMTRARPSPSARDGERSSATAGARSPP